MKIDLFTVDSCIVSLEWISIPAGNFTMGSTAADTITWPCSDAEYPQHTVYLDAFQISKYEITNAQYKAFMDAGGYANSAYWTTEGWNWRTSNSITEPRYWSTGQYYNIGPSFPNYPVMGVSWYEADAFCRWAGARLPSEAEWEKAARGTDARNYPWGNMWDAAKCNSYDNASPDTFTHSSPVGYFTAGISPYGVYDMVGNATEWCNDWYQDIYYTTQTTWSNPAGPISGTNRVLHGGCWFNDSDYCRSAYRFGNSPEYWILYCPGFRPVK